MDFDAVLKNLTNNGYDILPGYWPTAKCQAIKEEFDTIFTKFDSKVQRLFKEQLGGDERLFRIEAVSEFALSFAADPFLNELGSKYTGELLKTCFSMGGRLFHTPGATLNSGGDWHKDSLKRQFKALLYITDVTADNGPFAFLPGTQASRLTGDVAPTRFSNESLGQRLKEQITVVGEAGTCLVVDTSYIHRGTPIVSGSRYSLTNYCYSAAGSGCAKVLSKITDHVL